MRRTAVFFLVLLVFTAVAAMAQPVKEKKWEFSAATSFTYFKFGGSTDSQTALNLPLRIGYYVWKGLEIEPELMLTKIEGRDLGYLTSGNVAYNFRASEALVPFVLAGAGFGNGLAYVGIVDGSSGADSIALHLGAGIKCLVGTSAAVRLEYRYTHYRISESMFGVSNYDAHQILGGASVFF